MILPLEIIIEILLKLPAKSLLQYKIVCKLWYDLIKSPYFVKLHLQNSLATRSNLHFVFGTPNLHLADFDTFDNPIELNYPYKYQDNFMHYYVDIRILGSCHGLLCFQSFSLKFPLVIYNPTTQTHKQVPFLALNPPFSLLMSKRIEFGFGYDSFSDDFKCVAVIWNQCKDFEWEVRVYSLKDDIWRTPYVDSHLQHFPRKESVCSNDTIYWVCEDFIMGDVKLLPIVAFDLRVETFSTIPLPSLDIAGVDHIQLGILDGCLCLSINGSSGFHVWVMKEYGVVGSWFKLFGLSDCISKFSTAICYSMNFNKILVGIVTAFYLRRVASVDLKTMDVTVVDLRRCLKPHLCVENLLMLEVRSDMIDEEEQQAFADRARSRIRRLGMSRRRKRS